eukprot:Opistho-2@24314
MVALTLPRLGIRRNAAIALLILTQLCIVLYLKRDTMGYGPGGSTDGIDDRSVDAEMETCLGSLKPQVKMPRRGPITYAVHGKTPLTSVMDLKSRGWKPQLNADQPAVVLLTTYKDWKRMSAKYLDGAHFVNLISNSYHLAFGPIGLATKQATSHQMGCQFNQLPFVLPAYDLSMVGRCAHFVEERFETDENDDSEANAGINPVSAWRFVLNSEFWMWADDDTNMDRQLAAAASSNNAHAADPQTPAAARNGSASVDDEEGDHDGEAAPPVSPSRVVPVGYALTHAGLVVRSSRLFELLGRPNGCETLERQRLAYPHPPQNLFVQKCLAMPMLIGRRRFFIRSYLLIASTSPYMVFRRDGYVQRFVDQFDPDGLVDVCDHAFDGKRRALIGGQGDGPAFAAKSSSAQADKWKYPGVDLAPDAAQYEERKVGGRATFNEGMLTLDMEQFEKQFLDSQEFEAGDYATLQKRLRHIERFVFEGSRAKLRRRRGSFQLVTVDIGLESDGNPMLLSVDINPTLQVSLSVWVQTHSEKMFKESMDLVMDVNMKPWDYATMTYGATKFGFEIILNERMEKCGPPGENLFASYDFCIYEGTPVDTNSPVTDGGEDTTPNSGANNGPVANADAPAGSAEGDDGDGPADEGDADAASGAGAGSSESEGEQARK